MEDKRAARIAALFAELVELMADAETATVPTPRPTPDALLTVEEAAERLRIGRTRMFALLKSGEIDSVQIGHSRRIHPHAIDAYTRRLLTGHEANDS
ncbi:MAG TPA: helix-turn-helix domain-containing protein [Pseudonocardiaceae bacterium]|nr:helix-turn-helix domain-containing protein [Pseudonocardiaceae bacterium]